MPPPAGPTIKVTLPKEVLSARAHAHIARELRKGWEAVAPRGGGKLGALPSIPRRRWQGAYHWDVAGLRALREEVSASPPPLTRCVRDPTSPPETPMSARRLEPALLEGEEERGREGAGALAQPRGAYRTVVVGEQELTLQCLKLMLPHVPSQLEVAAVISEMLSLARVGAYNCHNAPLPAYAGAHAATLAVFNEEASHGCTFHEMTATNGWGIVWQDSLGIKQEQVHGGPVGREPGQYDDGRIVAQRTFPLDDRDTALSCELKAHDAGLAMFQELLDKMLGGEGEGPSITPERLFCTTPSR
eukprot:jgi/Mesvir1/5339/Mv15428-RA.1